MKRLIIATRGSKLALWQSNYIKSVIESQNPDLEVELKIIVTTGDKIIDRPLAAIGGKGLFLKELEEAMLRGEAQIAVHSLKDVPTVMPKGLILGAVTAREDVRDAMLSENYKDILSLPKNAIVGTSSLRRAMQIKKIRQDINIKDLRGNIDTRIKKLKEKEFDAIILASAGINRLGFAQDVKYVYNIPICEMVPSMGQGALGIESVDNPEILKIVSKLEDQNSTIETSIERGFVDMLNGGCHVPIGINARVLENNKVCVEAVLGLPDGSKSLDAVQIYDTDNYEILGNKIAKDFIFRGAKELLKEAEMMVK